MTMSLNTSHALFGNLKLLLESAGSSLDRLVQVHALIYDSIEYDVLNRVYRQYVTGGPPARSAWSAQIEAGFKVQLDVIARAAPTCRTCPESVPATTSSSPAWGRSIRSRASAGMARSRTKCARRSRT